MGPRRPPMRAALRRCRKGRMTGSDWREPVRTHVSLGTSMPKITGILKIYPPQRSAGGVWETRSKAEGFPHGTFQGAQRACGCGKPPNEMVWDGASSPGFSMAASRPLGWGRTCPLASVPDMPVRKVSIRRWMARMAEKEPIRVRMGSGISGLSLKVVNRWYGRRSACARGATPCGLAGFAPTFKRSVRGKSWRWQSHASLRSKVQATRRMPPKGVEPLFSFKITPRRPAGLVPRRVERSDRRRPPCAANGAAGPVRR